ncbi:MAG: uroporphyrinogen decarboxylase family protein [Fusobacteriaceae bacterium]
MSKQILIDTLKHLKTERAPWVPFSGIHAGKLLGFNAEEVLKDEEKLFKSLLEVNKLYKPDGQPIVFDLQVEAEILGCDLVWSKDTPPSVSTHPLEGKKEIPCDCTIPSEEDGRLPMILKVMKKMKEKVGDKTALYGLVCGPFTLASHLRGNEIFIDMYDDPKFVCNLIKFCGKVNIALAKYYANAGMDVIATVDPLVSQISEEHFKEFLSDEYSNIFSEIRKIGVYSSFFVCGDATRNIDAMCKTKPDSISVDENINMLTAKAITDKYNIALGGNLPLTTVMLHGTQEDNMKSVVDLIEKVDRHNLIVSPGCDMPYAVPIENAIAASEAVHDIKAAKLILENYKHKPLLEGIEVDLPDYKKLKKPLIEAMTLDSASCAACGYMMNIVNEVQKELGEKIESHEYKFTEKENIARCVKMGVKNLPALYINGELKYSSIIPSAKELINAIKKMPNYK